MSHHHRRAAAISAPDPYFSNTVLLLTGNGTNGGQNNTFIDSSSNNFTITRNGNTTQGSFSPFGYNWSNYFDGSGDFLTVANNTALQMSGDFTWEAWVFPISNPSGGNYKTFWAQRASSGGLGGPAVVLDSSGNYLLFISNAGATAWAVSGFDTGLDVTLNQWQHIALVKSGTTVTLYKNGVAGTSTTHSTAVGTSGSLSIMAGAADGSQAVDGYMSNFRIVKGTALYTSNFTPPTAPLSAITNTSLLTCQSNRFVDNSSNAFTITRNGDVRVSNFAPFPAGEYAASVEGGSGYFDGNGDNLTVADNAAFEFGSGSFSVDCWVYISSLKGYQAFVSKPGATDGNGWNLYIENNNTFRFIAGTGGSWTINIGPTVAVAGQWYHVCITRDTSNQWRLFLNGKLNATTNNSFSQPDLAYPLYVGKYPNFPAYSSSKDFGGYMASLRIVKGGMPSLFDTSTTTVGTQVFTPPTGPYTGSESLTAGSVSLLMNFTNGSIVDATGKNDLETVGNAQISTSVKKFGTGSMAFDGTGDYLTGVGSTELKLGTGDFTIEFWIYFSSVSGQSNIMDFRGSAGTPAIAPVIYRLSGVIRFFTNGADRIVGSTTVTTGQWYHIALARSGTSTKLFLNGTQEGSTYTDSNSYDIGVKAPSIGSSFNTNSLNGNIDDLRITKAARYTANFTPPYRQLPTR